MDRAKYKPIFNTFWPLALSWLFMAADNPMVSAIVSRMKNPEINLAAHGGIVYPVSLIIEAPIMMMLSVSIALSKDRLNFRRIYRFMMILCAGLTIIHAAICFTPLFYVIVRDIIGAPPELFHYTRLGLILMIPWTWSIGYRRFYQGVLIRSGYSKYVTVGTIVRMTTLLSVLLIGYALREFVDGAVVAAAALAAGVFAEGMYAGYRGRIVAKATLDDGISDDVIAWKELIMFCIPLVLMQLINLGWIMLGSSAISRMINPIASLAVWPVISGLLNMLKSFGNACNEITLSLVKRDGFYRPLLISTILIGLLATSIYALLIFTPVGDFWFVKFSALTPDLAGMAGRALPYVFLLPFGNALLNFYQGILLAEKQSRGLFEGLLVFLMGVMVFLGAGIWQQKWAGIYVITWGMNFGILVQTLWLRIRTNRFIKQIA